MSETEPNFYVMRALPSKQDVASANLLPLSQSYLSKDPINRDWKCEQFESEILMRRPLISPWNGKHGVGLFQKDTHFTEDDIAVSKVGNVIQKDQPLFSSDNASSRGVIDYSMVQVRWQQNRINYDMDHVMAVDPTKSSLEATVDSGKCVNGSSVREMTLHGPTVALPRVTSTTSDISEDVYDYMRYFRPTNGPKLY